MVNFGYRLVCQRGFRACQYLTCRIGKVSTGFTRSTIRNQKLSLLRAANSV